MPLDSTSSQLSSTQQYSPPSIGTQASHKPTPNVPIYSTPITRLEIFTTNLSNPVVTSISGSVGGLASGVVTCPLDVIKTKLQAQGGFQAPKPEHASAGSAAYRGLVGTAESIWREEGVRGMYRGLFPIILGYFPTWAVYFTVYDSSKEYFYRKLGEGKPVQSFVGLIGD